MVKLTQKRIDWLVKQVVKYGKKPIELAPVYDITERRIRQLVQHYRTHRTMPTLKKERRPRTWLTEEQKSLILQSRSESKLSNALSLRLYIKKHYEIILPQNKLHSFLLEQNIAQPDPKKQKQRKYCRYERKHSFSLVHLDWHESKAVPGKQVCVVEDDASRIILTGGEFDSAEARYNIALMNIAIHRANEYYNSTIREVNTDRGSQFYANKSKRNSVKGIAEFEISLAQWGIKHILSRRNHPQTNGKQERWFRTYEENRRKFNTFREFVEWYNNRIHLGLNRKEGITPQEAVINKLRPECSLGLFWRWIDEKRK